ncbi:MAG: limonene-1,2-epoxide hydrolase family protein, partial [Alphaproteobacteria bacterium]
EILDIFAAGGRVVTERVDHFDFGTARVALPIVGLFEFDGEGRIAAWREYFDLKTWYDQGGPPVE